MRKCFLKFASILLVPAIAFGQFGGLVIDVVQEAHSASQLLNDIQKIQQLTNMYNQLILEYQQMIYNAKYMGSRRGWMGRGVPMILSTTRSLFGETAGWGPAVNMGTGIPGAYGQATYGIHPAPVYSSYPISNSLMSANIATVNVADGMEPAAMLAIANSRVNQPLNEQALTGLEATSQDTSLDTNSEVEQLNQINGSTVLLNRQMQNVNALLTAQTEQQILANKVQRDYLSDSVNFYSEMDLAQPAIWGNSAGTVAGW